VRSKKAKVSDWDAVEATPSVSQWDATPGRPADATPGRWDATPTPAGSRWDATPGRGDGATPARKNRWDETPTPGRVRRRLQILRLMPAVNAWHHRMLPSWQQFAVRQHLLKTIIATTVV